jgi:uncharacterized protein YecT (DUF1311 family)
MKIFYLLLCFSIFCIATHAQGLESKEFKAAKKKLIYQRDSLVNNKPLDDYNGGWIAKLEKEFYIDTFYLERLWQLEINYNGSTMGMNQATRKAETAYDKLLNKYYKMLFDQLQGKDKETLKVSQRNWLKYRDSERSVNYSINNKDYTGGGTIHSIFVTNRNTDIVKQRVIELYHYLDRMWQITKKK